MCKRTNWGVCLFGFIMALLFMGSVSAGVTGPGSFAVPVIIDIFADACESSPVSAVVTAKVNTESIGGGNSNYIQTSFNTWHADTASPCMIGCKTDNRYTVMVNMLMLERLAAIPIGGKQV